jgi:hypothetical protein
MQCAGYLQFSYVGSAVGANADEMVRRVGQAAVTQAPTTDKCYAFATAMWDEVCLVDEAAKWGGTRRPARLWHRNLSLWALT